MTAETVDTSEDPAIADDQVGNSRDDLWRTLQTVSEWIRVADAKAGACLAVAGAMLALFAARLRGSPSPGVPATAVLFSAIGLTACSALFAVWTVLPRARRLGANSLVHYGTIAACSSAEQYHAAVSRALAEPGEFNQTLTKHIWTMARAARNKYTLVHWSIRFLICAILIGILALSLK